ncbi:MAG: hypothetical protein KAX49_12940 [Halanaerobiales bacterium]|nr:hypothetical protein [Halanaerobiales bacterium]
MDKNEVQKITERYEPFPKDRVCKFIDWNLIKSIREHKKSDIEAKRQWYRDTYLKSIHWKRLRDILISDVDYKCEECHKKRENLECHHLTYDNLGRELREDIKVLCKRCHTKKHPKRIKTKTKVKSDKSIINGLGIMLGKAERQIKELELENNDLRKDIQLLQNIIKTNNKGE